MQSRDDQTKLMTTAGLNLIAQALSIYDSDLRLVISNTPFQQIFSLPPALVTPGATFEDTIRHLTERGEYGDVTDIDAFVTERVDQARAFQPHYMERTRANGQTISVEGSPLPQGGWVTVYTDITRTKQQEALLRARSDALSDQVMTHAEELAATNRARAAMITTLEETKRQLTESEARMRLTTEMMPAHIAHVDANGCYTYSNRRLSSVIPGRPSNIIGLHISEALGDFAFARVSPALQQAYQGTPAITEFTEEPSAHRIRTSFTPDTRGGVYILSMDITEETQSREALQQTHKRELAAQVISGLAHDFSNLLTIILGLQSRLGRLPDLPKDAHALIEGTLNAARRGGGLLTSIADTTSPRALRPVATDLAQFLNDLKILAEPTLPNGLTLTVQDDAPETHALIDKGKLQDGLLNLILNARDACGARGQISLTQKLVRDTWVEWIITDTGPGFAETALNHALDPFFTTKGSEGSGLGLPMVYDMTKSAGGDLQIANLTAGGAQITLRLPFRRAAAATTGLILLVEDENEIRANVRDLLMDMGHSVIEATSADEASALVADLPDITMVLSDIQLEGAATGLDLANRIGSTTPMILMTSLPAEDALFLEAQRRASVLQKPITQAALAAVMQPDMEQIQ
jgi:signal transduction histidine kinase